MKKGTALITGASSGIGKELARLFAADEHDVVLVARDRIKLDELARELCNKVRVTVIPADLSDPTTPQALVNELNRQGITIDYLVNNAGTQVYGLFAETDLNKQLALIQVNLTGLTALTGLLVPGMLQRGHGKILNLGSTGSFAPGALNAVYCATKAYVLSFSQALAVEMGNQGVTVTALCPGATDTAFASRAGLEHTRLFKYAMDAKSVARSGYKAMKKGRRVVVPGWINRLQAIFYPLFIPLTPTPLFRRIAYYLLG